MHAGLMFKKYEKTDAPAWQRRLVLILTALFCATILLYAAWTVMLFIDRARIQDCQDKGGHYDYEAGVCDLERSHDSPDE